MYDKLIANAIGTTDPTIAVVVEEIMRDGRSGLDGLNVTEFNRAARQAYGDVKVLAVAGCLGEYCDALGIETPAVVYA